jgi:hypothetical protein
VTAKLPKTAAAILGAVIVTACGSAAQSAHDANTASPEATASPGAPVVSLSQATAPPRYVPAGTVSSSEADLDACKAWWLSPAPSKSLPSGVQVYDADRPALRWLHVVSPPLAAALGAEQASDLAGMGSGAASTPAAGPSALLQADAVGADCLSLFGSQLTKQASEAATDLAFLTQHVGNGFGQTSCDLLSPQLLNQWYAVAAFSMNTGDASLIDNVEMSSGVNQTGGSDCQYAWEPGYQIGGQVNINFYESQSPAAVMENIPDVGSAAPDQDIAAPGALYAQSVGESPSFTVVVFPAGSTSVAVSCTATTARQCSFVTAVVLLRLIDYHYPNDAVQGVTTLP